jgi:hypothetical protein
MELHDIEEQSRYSYWGVDSLRSHIALILHLYTSKRRLEEAESAISINDIRCYFG